MMTKKHKYIMRYKIYTVVVIYLVLQNGITASLFYREH